MSQQQRINLSKVIAMSRLAMLRSMGYASGDDMGAAGYNPRFDPGQNQDPENLGATSGSLGFGADPGWVRRQQQRTRRRLGRSFYRRGRNGWRLRIHRQRPRQLLGLRRLQPALPTVDRRALHAHLELTRAEGVVRNEGEHSPADAGHQQMTTHDLRKRLRDALSVCSMKRGKQRRLAIRLKRAVMTLPNWSIERVRAGASEISVLVARIGELKILRTTPSTKNESMPAKNGIDIWAPNGKVFSSWWSRWCWSLAAALAIFLGSSTTHAQLLEQAARENVFDGRWVTAPARHAALTHYLELARVGEWSTAATSLDAAVNVGVTPDDPMLVTAVALAWMAANQPARALVTWNEIVTQRCVAVSSSACHRAVHGVARYGLSTALLTFHYDTAASICSHVIALQHYQGVTNELLAQCPDILASSSKSEFDAAYRLAVGDAAVQLRYLQAMVQRFPDLGQPQHDLENVATTTSDSALAGHAWYLRAKLETSPSLSAAFYTHSTSELTKYFAQRTTSRALQKLDVTNEHLARELFESSLSRAETALATVTQKFHDDIVPGERHRALRFVDTTITPMLSSQVREVLSAGQSRLGWTVTAHLFAASHYSTFAVHVRHIGCFDDVMCRKQQTDIVNAFEASASDECRQATASADTERLPTRTWLAACSLQLPFLPARAQPTIVFAPLPRGV